MDSVLGLTLPSSILLGVVAATEWSNTITLGSLVIGVLVGTGSLIAIAYGARYKVGYEAASAAATELRKSLADEMERGDRLEAALAASQAGLAASQEAIGEMRETIARLENLPNVQAVVEMMAHENERADKRAQERLERGITTINRITEDQERRQRERHEELMAMTAEIAAACRPPITPR